MSGPLVLLIIMAVLALVGQMLGNRTQRNMPLCEESVPPCELPAPVRRGRWYRFRQWTRGLWDSSESSATLTILGLWALVMGALYFFWPDQFKQFWNWRDHMVFLGLPLLLVIIVQALDRPTRTPATKWIGGVLLTTLIVIYIIVVAEQFGMSFNGTEEVAGRTLRIPAGETRWVEFEFGKTVTYHCSTDGNILIAEQGLPVPCGPNAQRADLEPTVDPQTGTLSVGFLAPENSEMIVLLW